MRHRTRQVLPAVVETNRLLQAFEAAARKRGLPSEKRHVYKAWIIGFICWCLAHPPGKPSPDRISSFLSSLQQHPRFESRFEEQATGALTFLFGPVQRESRGKICLLEDTKDRSEGVSIFSGSRNEDPAS